jgi:thioredoxin reductase
MLVATNLQPVAKEVVYGEEKNILQTMLLRNLATIKGEDYTDKRVVVKGCGDVAIPEAAYVEITKKLRPYVKSIMYGEPCSTVPIFKRK